MVCGVAWPVVVVLLEPTDDEFGQSTICGRVAVRECRPVGVKQGERRRANARARAPLVTSAFWRASINARDSSSCKRARKVREDWTDEQQTRA